MANASFGEPEFHSTTQLQQYVKSGRALLRPLYHELHVAAAELEAALKHVPSSNPSMFNADSRVRAKLVAKHLRHSADAVEVATSNLVRTYASFLKHYTNELDASRAKGGRRQFHFDQ